MSDSASLVSARNVDVFARSERTPATTAARRCWMHACGRLSVPLDVLSLFVIGSMSLRVALFVAFAGNADAAMFLRMIWAGLRMDATTGALLLLPQVLFFGLASNRFASCSLVRLAMQATWLFGFLMLPFLWAIEWLFFAEFDCRLNYVAFEYLVYPQEVCCNIWQSYPIVPLITAIAAVGASAFWLIRPRFLAALQSPLPWRRRATFTLFYLLATCVLAATTSMATMDVSSNRVVNECASSGLYSFAYYARTCRFDFERLYLTVEQPVAFDLVRRQTIRLGDSHHAGSPNPIDRTITTANERHDYNVVVILEESFGSDFVGALGDDRGLTPEFDALTHDGLLFDNVFATGNRTARALEAVLASLPPIPTESILKRDHSDHVYTLANVLAERGYQRLFMTGGRGVFDGVRSFMTANGFDRFIEQSDFDSPVFTNAWGVSDEDLFHRALDECDQMQTSGRPFFAMVLTVSNHRPYTFPRGRVTPEGQSRENAVRYADWALGDFFRKARKHAFFDKTIFVVAGDHGARVYGAQMFPLSSYRVPMLVIHPDKKGGERCHTLACSLDVAPTIMGLLGGAYRSTFFGQDILQVDTNDGRALMQHNHDIARLDANGSMVVLGARKNAHQFRVEPATDALIPSATPDKNAVDEVVAAFQSAYQLYYSDRCWPDVASDSDAATASSER